jgi:hypothetical protein
LKTQAAMISIPIARSRIIQNNTIYATLGSISNARPQSRVTSYIGLRQKHPQNLKRELEEE